MTVATRLTGKELLATVQKMKGSTKTELAKACGYVKTTVHGDERCQFTAFYQAVAEANGLSFTEPGSTSSNGRPLTYSATVLTTGAILIGPRYVEELGLTPGQKVTINTSSKRISLTPLSEG